MLIIDFETRNNFTVTVAGSVTVWYEDPNEL